MATVQAAFHQGEALGWAGWRLLKVSSLVLCMLSMNEAASFSTLVGDGEGEKVWWEECDLKRRVHSSCFSRSTTKPRFSPSSHFCGVPFV